MPFTLFDLVPNGIAKYRSEADWASKTSNPAPRDPSKPTKLWADTTVTFGWWNFFDPNATREYWFFARKPDGTIDLTPVDVKNPKFNETYDYTAVRAIVDRSFLFPAGVPYLVKKSMTAQDALQINIAGDPAQPMVDYPVSKGDNYIFTTSPDGRSVIGYTLEEFGKLAKPPQMTDSQRVELVKNICNSTMTPGHKIQAIRTAITDYYPQVVIT